MKNKAEKIQESIMMETERHREAATEGIPDCPKSRYELEKAQEEKDPESLKAWKQTPCDVCEMLERLRSALGGRRATQRKVIKHTH